MTTTNHGFGGISDDLRYYEFELDSYAALRSFTSSYPSTIWPTFQIGGKKPLQTIAALKILEVNIPFTYYVFTDVNGGFLLNEGGLDVAVIIPAGNYNIGNFTTALAAALTLGSVLLNGFTYSVTYSTITGKVSIFNNAALTTPFTLTFPPNYWMSPAQWIGFNLGAITTTAFLASGTPKGNWLESPNVINLSGANYIYVNSQLVGNLADQYLPIGQNNTGNSGTQLAKVPVSTNSGGNIGWVGRLVLIY